MEELSHNADDFQATRTGRGSTRGVTVALAILGTFSLSSSSIIQRTGVRGNTRRRSNGISLLIEARATARRDNKRSHSPLPLPLRLPLPLGLGRSANPPDRSPAGRESGSRPDKSGVSPQIQR